MNKVDDFVEIQGIKCYSQMSGFDDSNYPDSGFDFMDNSSEKSFWIQSRNRLFKKIVQKFLKNSTCIDYLEIGCGTGGFIRHIKENKSLNITGSEIHHKGLVFAKRNQPEINFIQYDVVDKPLNSRFDVIVAFDVLEHIENDLLALNNINKMMKDGGVFIMSVPQHMFLWSRLDEIVKHQRRYSRSELSQKMAASGFEVEYVSSFVFTLFPLMWLSRIFDKGVVSPDVKGESELEARVVFNPFLNWILNTLMRVDEFLIHRRISLPFGGTLVAIAKKTS